MSKDAKKLASRNANRSRTPQSDQFMKYIGSGWAERDDTLPPTDAVAPYAAKRRAAVAKAF
jgi:Xaa-Pro aminopeptidase